MSPSPRFSPFLGLIQGFMEISDPIQDTFIQGPILRSSDGFIWFSIQCLPPRFTFQGSHPGSQWRCEILCTRSHPRSQKISQVSSSFFFFFYKFSLNPKGSFKSHSRSSFFVPSFDTMDFVLSFDLFFFSFPNFSFTLGKREREKEIPLFVVCLLYVGLFFPSTCDNLVNLLVKVFVFLYFYIFYIS